MKEKSSLVHLYQARYLNANLGASLHSVSTTTVQAHHRLHSLSLRHQNPLINRSRMAVRMICTPPPPDTSKQEKESMLSRKKTEKEVGTRKHVRRMMQESYREMSMMQSSLGGEKTLKQILEKHYGKRKEERNSRAAIVQSVQSQFRPLRPNRSRYGGRDLIRELRQVEGRKTET